MNNIFLPKEITVGFQKREDTYTKKLAYIVYKDEKGILRKEKSWNSWRDKDINPQIEENVPTSGFELNKKAGDYSTGWNHRQTYIRVYDPRGFEFEITIKNLLYILENTISIKSKVLDGEFVYGWDGKDLMLIPTSAHNYKDIIEFSEKVKANNKISVKDLIIGGTYLTRQNEKWIYMCKSDFYKDCHDCSDDDYSFYNNGQLHLFYNIEYNKYENIASINRKLIDVIDDKCCYNYSDLFDKLEHLFIYSPMGNDRFEEYDYNDFNAKLTDKNGYSDIQCFYKDENNEYLEINVSSRNNIKPNESKVELMVAINNSEHNYYKYKTLDSNLSIKEIFEKYKPLMKIEYLKNGKKFKGICKYNEE